MDVQGAEDVHEGLDATRLRHSHFVRTVQAARSPQGTLCELYDWLWDHKQVVGCQGRATVPGMHFVLHFGVGSLLCLMPPARVGTAFGDELALLNVAGKRRDRRLVMAVMEPAALLH